MKNYEYFIKIFGAHYPISHALWRTFEAQKLAEFTFSYPLLDVGCGDGFFLKTLHEGKKIAALTQEEKIFGLDPWEEMCKKARAIGLYAQVDCADARRMPYSDNSFSFVFSNSVIEHIDDVDLVLQEIVRVLKPDGYFLFSAPTDALGSEFFWSTLFEKLHMKGVAQWYRNKVNATFVHHNLFNKEEWARRLENHGFVIEDFRYTLCPQSERMWDALLSLSYIQLMMKNVFNLKKVPFAWLNTYFLKKCVDRYAAFEESCLRGGNCIIYARIKK